MEPGNQSLPHSIDAERSVLGGVLLDDEVLAEIEGRLEPGDFYRRAHGTIWQAMTTLASASKPIDLVTLTERLKDLDQLEACGGIEYISTLDSGVPTASHAVSYADIVREKAILRRLITTANNIFSEGMSGPPSVAEFIEHAEQEVFKITQEQDERHLTEVGKIAGEVFHILEKRFTARSDITGVGTGFMDLNKLTAGLQPGELIILASRPSMGKTALALNLAVNAALRNDPPSKVAVFSLEMSMEALVMRMLSSEARVKSDYLRTGKIPKDDWPKLATAAARLSDSTLLIDDSPAITPAALRSKCRRMKAKMGLDLVVVDYLQLMRGSGDSREQEIAAISRSLKELSKELMIPVLALSQLNRSLERRENKRPQLADLRESGAIEQDADVIMFIHREERYQHGEASADQKGLAELIVSKQRNGPTGTVELIFFEEYTRFDNYDRLGP